MDVDGKNLGFIFRYMNTAYGYRINFLNAITVDSMLLLFV